MTEEEWWLTTCDLVPYLSSVRETERQRSHLHVECLKRVGWVVPGRGLELLLKAGEEFCRNRAGEGVVWLARDRVIRSLAGSADLPVDVWAVADVFFRPTGVNFAALCGTAIRSATMAWIDHLPQGQSGGFPPTGNRYLRSAWRRWNEVWQASERLDSWAGSFNHVRMEARTAASEESERDFRHEITPLLRCIIGNPFRPVAVDDSWRSETVVALATGIYADRAFDCLPILADALEEAGCDHPDILAHCRDPQQPHARGCWVVDEMLGKS